MEKPNFQRSKSFTKGFILATFLSSALLYAGTLVDGIYQFAGGEPISATEMNHNFQRIRGNVIAEASNTQLIYSQLGTPEQECESAVVGCNAGYVALGNVTAGTISSRTDPSASVANTTTAGGPMSYVEIPADGFYEVTIITDPSSYTISPPDELYESTTANINFAVIKFDATDPTQGTITSNTSAMDTPRVDGFEIYSDVQTESMIRRGDDSGDGVEDYFVEDIDGGDKVQMYLKAGDGLALFYWIIWDNFYTPVATDELSFNVGSVKFKVKQVLD